MMRASIPVVAIGDVPCNGCTACCQNDAVRILPHEDASLWQTQPHPYVPGALMLKHAPNGDCVYLVRGKGCIVHGAAPQQCREMDCRAVAAALGYTKARKLIAQGAIRADVIRRGRELLRGQR